LVFTRYDNSVETITKVGKIHFMVSGSWSNSKFRIDSGNKVSTDKWYYTYAKLITDEQAKEIEYKKKVDAAVLRMQNDVTKALKGLSYEKLIKILEVINSSEDEKKTTH